MYIFSLSCVVAVVLLIVLARNIEDFSFAKTLSDLFGGLILGIAPWTVFAVMMRVSHHLVDPISTEDIVTFAVLVIEAFGMMFVYDKIYNARKRYDYVDKAVRLGLSIVAVAVINIVSVVYYIL